MSALVASAGGWLRFIGGGIVGTLYMIAVLWGLPLAAVALGVAR